MVLIIVGEFADNVAGDDIKFITHNSKLLEEDALMNIIVATYLGLYSSGGNSQGEKYGTIPLENNRSATAWSVTTRNKGITRLLLTVVPTNELSEIMAKVNKKPVIERINQVKSILMDDNVDVSNLDRAISLLASSLYVKDEVSRLSDVFGKEI